MNLELVALQAVLATIVTASTPLLLAALGELVTERSGVLNLGVEGMMVLGAVAGFAVALVTGSPYLGILASALAGAALAVPFGFLTLNLVANQVATGLALTLLGLGLSGLVGEHFVGQPGVRLDKLHLPLLSDIPDSMSRLYAGRLSDGRFYLVNNAIPTLLDRRPLMLLLSDDGIQFNEVLMINDSPTEMRRKGLLEINGHQYPCCLVDGDRLFVAYDANKEDLMCEVIDTTRIPRSTPAAAPTKETNA